MDKTVFNDYVENRYKKQMKYYSDASAKNQKRYKQFQWVLIILSAATPILAALASRGIGDAGETDAATAEPAAGYNALQIIVVIISGIVAILTAGLKTFRYQELWIIYRLTNEKLKPEIHYYNFNVGPYADNDIDKESLFVARVEAMLNEEHTQWPPAKKLQEDLDRQNENATAGNGGGDSTAPQPQSGGEQPAVVDELAEEVIPGESDESGEIIDASGETDKIAQAEEVSETDISGEAGMGERGEADETDKDAQPDNAPKQT